MATIKSVLIMASIAFLFSCDKEDSNDPKATSCFDYSPKTELQTGNEILFTNCSENAAIYVWDFGDGHISTEKEPKHTYESDGEFTVKLIVTNEASADTFSQELIIESSRVSYLKHFGTTYPLTKSVVFKYTYEGSKRFLLNLGGDEMNIADDDISGRGEGVTVYAIGEFSEGTFTILDDSWALSEWVSKTDGPGTGNSSSLEGGTIKVISASDDSIEIEIDGANTEVYYKGDVSVSGKY